MSNPSAPYANTGGIGWRLPELSEIPINSSMGLYELKDATSTPTPHLRVAYHAGALLAKQLGEGNSPNYPTMYVAAVDHFRNTEEIADSTDAFIEYGKRTDGQCLAWGIREALQANMRRAGPTLTVSEAINLTGYTYAELARAGLLGYSNRGIVRVADIVGSEKWHHQGFAETTSAPTPVTFLGSNQICKVLCYDRTNTSKAFSTNRPPSFRVNQGRDYHYSADDIFAIRDIARSNRLSLNEATNAYAEKFPFRHLIVRGQFERHLSYMAERRRLTADFISELTGIHVDYVRRHGTFSPSGNGRRRTIQDVQKGIMWTQPEGL